MSAATLIWILLALAAAIVIWASAIYNMLVKRKNHVEDAWSGIEVQLKKRHNLVPNLVKTVKGFTEHEASLQKAVTRLRVPQKQASLAETSALEQTFSKQLSGIMVQIEAYPDIKADGNFQRLQDQLSIVESDIERARRYYNGSVRNSNTLIQSFPSNLVADRYGFTDADFFELDLEAARQVPEISFD